MNIQVLNDLFNAADELNDDMVYGDFCYRLGINNTDGVLCHNCKFYRGSKEGCLLSNALSILDDAKSVYKILIKNN